MKTPDEIKKGLECCAASYADCHKECPYKLDCDGSQNLKDALALIQRLQNDNAQQARCIENMTDKLNTMNDEVAKLQAERDAALADFKLYRERNIKGECGVYACDLCKVGGKYEEWEELKCPKGCMGIEHWQWRGVQKEDSDA